MERGLGQGSILAPLKWNLFLDPLLRLLHDTPDPYIIGSGADAQPLYAVAFADDMTVVASSHKGYRIRMAQTSEYLNFFQVELNKLASFLKASFLKAQKIQSTTIYSTNWPPS